MQNQRDNPDDDLAGVRSHGAPRTPSNSFNLLQSRRDIDPVPPSISLLSDIPIARRVWQSDLVTETREEGKTKNVQLTSRSTFHDDSSRINAITHYWKVDNGDCEKSKELFSSRCEQEKSMYFRYM